MEAGFAATRGIVNWVRTAGSMFDGSIFSRDRLVSVADAFPVAYIPGLRCRNCGIFTLDFASIQ